MERHARIRGLAGGLGVGAMVGAVWSGGEYTVAWAAGSVAPAGVWRTVMLANVALAAAAGGVVGVLVRAVPASGIALGVVLAFGFARIVAPPGVAGEVLYLALAVGVWHLALRLVGPDGRSLLAAIHVGLLGLVAVVGGGLALQAFRVPVPRGVWLLGAVLVAPLVVLGVDRVVAWLVPRRSKRVALELAVAVAIAFAWGRPLDVSPRVDPVVTGVPPPGGTPDVVLISLDTTRADHLSTYGYHRDTSPNLTRLAEDGLLYRMARSPASWTLPGHASMMTGLYPASHGAHLAGGWLGGESIDGRRNVAHPLAASHETLAELLRDHGFHTAAFVANFSYLYRDYGIAQGFGVYDDAPGLLLRVEPPIVRVLQLFTPGFCAKPFRTARAINHEALEWLDGVDGGRPVFLFLNYMEPHQPWVADPPYDRWAQGVPGAWTMARTNLYTHSVRDVSERTAAFIRANYDGQIAAMDAALGELLDALRVRGRYENAVIVVTSDHGELLGEHSEMGHMGRTLYEPLLRIPLVVKHPGADRLRGVVDHPVQLVDLVPTIAEVTGAPTPAAAEGVGLAVADRVIYAEEWINPFLVAEYGTFYDRAMRVVYEGRYKLISTSRGDRMLFDLEEDPGEARNLAADRPERVARLEALLATRGVPVLASTRRAAPPAAEEDTSTWRVR